MFLQKVSLEMAKPEAKLLNEHLQDLVYWEGFALQLPHFEQSHIDTINREESNNIAGQKQAMIDKWLELYPNASWEDVASALEVIGQNLIATSIRKTFLDHHIQKESFLPSKCQEMDEVKVEEGVVIDLGKLHDSFVSLTKDIKSEVESAEKNGCPIVERLVDHTKKQRAFPVSLDSISTSNDFFLAIEPHYNFLNFYLLLSLTVFLSDTIAIKSKKYEEDVQSFMMNTKIKHLRQKLQYYFHNSQLDNQVRVTISLQNAWGLQNVWLVKQLVQQLFSLEHPDQCQWFRIISG